MAKKRKKTEKRNKNVAAAKEISIKTQFNQGTALSMKSSCVWAKFDIKYHSMSISMRCSVFHIV